MIRKTEPIAVCWTQTEAEQIVSVYLPRGMPRSLDVVCYVKVPLMQPTYPPAAHQDELDEAAGYVDWATSRTRGVSPMQTIAQAIDSEPRRSLQAMGFGPYTEGEDDGAD